MASCAGTGCRPPSPCAPQCSPQGRSACASNRIHCQAWAWIEWAISQLHKCGTCLSWHGMCCRRICPLQPSGAWERACWRRGAHAYTPGTSGWRLHAALTFTARRLMTYDAHWRRVCSALSVMPISRSTSCISAHCPISVASPTSTFDSHRPVSVVIISRACSPKMRSATGRSAGGTAAPAVDSKPRCQVFAVKGQSKPGRRQGSAEQDCMSPHPQCCS